MAIGKRLRFEILKRDGFRCRYCGRTAVADRLQVDHVIAKANGGTDDPSNLVASCTDCNQGKSDVPLDETQLTAPDTAEMLREHAEQMREYLAAEKERERAEAELCDYLAGIWKDYTCADITVGMYNRLPGLLKQYPIAWLVEAIKAVGGSSVYSNAAMARYFYGVLRRKREETERG